MENNTSQKRLALNKPFSDLLNHIIHINSLPRSLSAPPMAVVFIGHGKTILSMETGDLMDGKLFLRLLSIKSGVFVDGQLCLRLAAKKSDIFLAGKIEDKKETPRKDVSVAIW